MSPTFSLPTGVFLLLRDLVGDRLGVWFEEDKRELLASKLSERVESTGRGSFLGYYYLLKYDLEAEAEWPKLIDVLSVQETYFWREFDQVRALVNVLVPEHVAAGRGPIRIWSAACATGEEPLTIAMALDEAGWFGRADIEVWASDASPAAIEAANRGIYRERSFRALSPALREKFFSPVAGGWQIDPRIRSRVRYSMANLLETIETRSLATARFIFCRNVFIYFSPTTVKRVVMGFADRMERPAHLFVGASESLLRMETPYQLEEISGAFVYVNR